MGKKGVLLDNGKTAQSSMTLYWKVNRERAKNPRQKKQRPINQQQQLDNRAINGYQKWKIHKQKLINKISTKKIQLNSTPKLKQQQNNLKQEQQNYHHQQDKNIYSKSINIPGYSSKQKLIKNQSLEIMNVCDQSQNILKFKTLQQNLTHEQIVAMIRKKQQKQMNKIKINKNRINIKKPTIDIILREEEERNQMNNNKIQEQIQLQSDKINKQQQYFKSNILNQLIKGDNTLIMPIQSEENKKKQVQQINTNIQTIKDKQQIIPKQQNLNSSSIVRIDLPTPTTKFIPHSLRK